MSSSFYYKILIINLLNLFFLTSLLGKATIDPQSSFLAPLSKNSKAQLLVAKKDTLPKPSKYYGYRLYLTQIKVEKETDNWVRINFSCINTGEKDVDFSQKGREHWVQVLFDDSLQKSKLGGFKDNIRQALYNANFKLEAGKIVTHQEVKFTKILEWSLKDQKPQEDEIVIVTPSKNNTNTVNEEELIQKKEKCPDLIFSYLKIVETKKKYVVLEYAVKNIGKGPAVLRKKVNGQTALIGIKVFLSGSQQVTRASKELGLDVVRAPYYKTELYPNEEIKVQTKVQTKGKNDFLKYLVLQIDSYALMEECDRRNNEKAIQLP